MFSLNHVELIGHLGKNPKLTYTTSHRAVTTLTVATIDRWEDSNGKPRERTQWHQIVCWGPLAENVADLKQGDLVWIVGRLQTRNYEDKQGQKKTAPEIIADKVGFLDPRDAPIYFPTEYNGAPDPMPPTSE